MDCSTSSLFLTVGFLSNYVDIGFASWRLPPISRRTYRRSASSFFLGEGQRNGGLHKDKNRADNSSPKSACYRLCVCASGSLITMVFNSFTLIRVSCLHFGQNRGKFSSTVSMRILIRVLLLQTGHKTHSVLPMCAHLLFEHTFICS